MKISDWASIRKRKLGTMTRVDEQQITTIDAAIRQLAARLGTTGHVPRDVQRDGSCYFHAAAYWLDRLLGSGASELLKSPNVSASAVSSFLCDWAEENFDTVIDDEGEVTVHKSKL